MSVWEVFNIRPEFIGATFSWDTETRGMTFQEFRDRYAVAAGLCI